MRPQGYNTYAGYRGYVPGIGWMLFASESDYYDYLEAEES